MSRNCAGSLPCTISTRLTARPSPSPQCAEFARGGVRAGGVDHEPVAFAQKRLHGVATHAHYSQILRIRAAFLAQHRIGQKPPRAFPRHLLVAREARNGVVIGELRDFCDRNASGRAAPLALGPLARRDRGVAQLLGIAVQKLRERFGVALEAVTGERISALEAVEPVQAKPVEPALETTYDQGWEEIGPEAWEQSHEPEKVHEPRGIEMEM